MTKKVFRLFLSLSFIAFALSEASAQNYSGHNWYFGNSTRAIKFSRSTNLPVLVNNKTPLAGVGGSAVATDQINSNLLFYTDGVNVFDVNNLPMTPLSGTLLGAPAQNQPVVVSKIPGVEHQYYIFHRDGAGTVRLSIVDMKQAGNAVFPSPPSGNLTTVNGALTGLTGRSQAMITIPHANEEDFWLITHSATSADYTVTLIQASGSFTNTTVSGLGFIQNAGNFSYHAGTKKIAVSPQEIQRDVEIVNFDNATGALTFDQIVPNSRVLTLGNGEAIYDTEWSNSGHYLYFSRHGAAGVQADVFQFDTRTPAISLVSVLPQPNTIARSYGLQLGPDSVMYHLYQATAGGPFRLGAFTDTDTVGAEVNYATQAFPGSLNFNAQQFSSFAPADSVGFTLSFTTSGTCSNTPTSFFPSVAPAADSLHWDFGDGQRSSDWSPNHTYTAGGAFQVRLSAFLNGVESAPVTQTVNITAFDLQITLPTDTTACSCELPLPKAVPPPPFCNQFTVTAQIQGSPTQIQWFGPGGLIAGQTTATLSPQEAGYYYVAVTDASGCTAYAGVNIKEYGVQDMRANIWHFGERAGIDFNPLFDNPPAAADPIPGPYIAPEGSSVISDRNGQVVLSTNGQQVFDRTGADITPAPNPPGLGGEPGSTQSALIVPVPGNEYLYYIFTTQQIQGSNTYQLKYSLFDLTKGTNGQLVQSNQLLFAKSTERITSNGNWLVAHEYGNNSFRAYRITDLGISIPVISSIGSDHNFANASEGQGYMEFGNGNKIAVALSSPSGNFIEFFDFVDSSGVVTNFHKSSVGPAAGQIYGLEFIGEKVFATIKNPPTGSTIAELFFDAQNVPQLVKAPQITVGAELGAIQVGPDGQYYVAVNGATSLGTIQVNADTTLASGFTLAGFNLDGARSLLGLPNFIQIISDPIQGPAIAVNGTCEDELIQFVGTPTDPIDEFFWQIKNSGGTVLTTSDSAQFEFLIADPGNYQAVLRLTNRCGLDTTITQNFQIFAKPPVPTFIPAGTQPVICASDLTLTAGTLPNTFLWSTGETTPSITVNRQAVYSVTVTTPQGCTSQGEIIVADNRPQLDLGPDVTLCEGVPLPPLDALNPGATYTWTVTDLATNTVVDNGTSQTQAVDSSVPGALLFRRLEYEVVIVGPGVPGFQCTLTESKIFTFNAAPVFTAAGNDPTACGTSDGSIDITFNSPPNTFFQYTVSGPSPVPSGTDQLPGSSITVPSPASLSVGSYGVTVADQLTGCATQTTVPISNNAFTVTLSKQNNCDPVNLVVQHTIANNMAYTYTVFDAITNAQVATGSGNTGTTNQFIVTGINAGSYNVVVASGGCSVVTNTVTPLTQDALATITGFTSTPCTNPVSITVNGPGLNSFEWTGPNILTGQNTSATITANPSQGPQTYTVKASAPGRCPVVQSVTINVNNDVTASFTQSDPCANQVTLTAAPSGPYTYQWFRAGAPISGGQSIVVTDNGTQYNVRITNTLSGCQFDSPSAAVVISGIITTVINFPNPIPCENTPFTLTTTTNQAGAQFKWFFNGTQQSQTTSSLNVTDARSGRYRVEATVSGCTADDEIDLVLAPSSPGLLPLTAIICPSPANPDPATRQVLLDAGPNFTSYQWFRDGSDLNESNQTYTATAAGRYTVELVNVLGCPSEDEIDIEEECEPRIVAPSAFRPMSQYTDGITGQATNKEFGVLTFFIDDDGFQVFIFNRWGEMIYSSTDRQFRWNGGYNNTGQLLPAGTYTYVVRYKSSYRPEDGTKEKRGGVVLVR